MKKVTTTILIVLMFFLMQPTSATEEYGSINQTAIILVHGFGGGGVWKEVSKELSRFLEGNHFIERFYRKSP